MFGIYAAFGIAPQTVTRDIPVSTVIEDVALPALDNVSLNQPENFWQMDQVRRDDTLDSLLSRLNIRNEEAISFLRYDRSASDLASNLRPGNSIQAQTTEDGELLKLQYETSSTSAFNVERTPTGYRAYSAEPELVVNNAYKSAVIKSSLFEATDSAGIPDQIAIQLADIFSSDIDFYRDLRRDDRFSVIYEASYHNGDLVKVGQVLAAEFVNQGKTYQAVLYRGPDGKSGYFTPDGKSLHKSFLRSPLEFTRISSGFSLGRFHPILQRIRAHKGVDYAAPIGTRVKAPADGVVAFVGKKGGYGNVIILKHDNGISTIYGHLSRFAASLHPGLKVSQGDIIGYVGMTGLATGPHLHYEFLVNGEHKDPLKVALPMAVPLPAQYKAAFLANSQALVAQLNLLSVSHLAALN
ncbi:MAG TPA: peptidoglycan DD-metalloendopeptidase family protein [Methylophilaceae bacterium]|nr:peptidoglycan DD-metalloendopeptidase family protein [Methylophilaceae bacterium]